MRVTSIILNNFMSFFGTHIVPMSDLGLVFIEGENLDEPRATANGAGKSTIFDALDWALFGESPRGDTAKSVINEEAKHSCWVIAELEDEDSKYLIYRYRLVDKQNGVRVWGVKHLGTVQNLTALDEAKTQATIETILGLDRRIFRAAVYRAQGDDFNFCAATDGERKEILTAVIPELQEVDVLKEKAKALHYAIQQERSGLQGGSQQASQELAGLKSKDWAQEEAAWAAGKAERLAAASTNAAALAEDLQRRSQIAEQAKHIAAHLQALTSNPFQPVTVASERYHATIKAHVIKQSEVEVLRKEYKALEAQRWSMASGLENGCPRCRQTVPKEHIHTECAALEREKVSLAESGKRLAAELAQLTEQLQTARVERDAETSFNNDSLAAFSQQIGKLQTELHEAQEIAKTIPQAKQTAATWIQFRDSIAAETFPLADQKAQSVARIQVLETYLQESANRVAELEQREKRVLFWLEALTPKGLKSLLLDSRVEQMTAAANVWVQALTGGTTWVRFETQTMGTKGLSEKMNVRIFRHNPGGGITERNFRSWSGGEKTRVALGADQGLARLIADRATKGWDIRILDETFAANLDAGGREAVFDQISKENCGTIFVVDHSNGTEGHFDQKWKVQIKNRRSQLLIEGKSCQVEGCGLQSFLPAGA